MGLLLTDTDDYETAFRYLRGGASLDSVRGDAGCPAEEATVLLGMAKLCAKSNRPREAVRAIERAARIEDFMIGEAFWSGSERQRALIVIEVLTTLHAYLTLAVRQFPEDSAVVRTAFDMVLRRKGISAEALAVQRDAVLRGRDSNLAPSLNTLRLRRAELVSLMLEGPDNTDSLDAYETRLAELRGQKEQLESELAQAIPELKLEESYRKADADSVAQALPGWTRLDRVRQICQFSALGDPVHDTRHSHGELVALRGIHTSR